MMFRFLNYLSNVLNRDYTSIRAVKAQYPGAQKEIKTTDKIF